MLNNTFSKKANTGGVKMELPSSQCIPYACHYTQDTCLTKNGELLQTIKITGFANESLDSSNHLELREAVRKAIKQNSDGDDFAFWINTIRKKTNLDPGGDFKPGFAENMNKTWKTHNGWNEMYINELYITVLIDGVNYSVTNGKEVAKSLYFGILLSSHNSYLKEKHESLQHVVDDMVTTLGDFGAIKLGMKERKGIFYSEPLEFFSKILNLAESPVPAPINDISEHIATHGVAVGFNTMEIRGATGKHFGAAITVKEYHELSTDTLDDFLQLPQEFIITQTLDFISHKKALKSFTRQKDIFNASGDSELSEASGLDRIIESSQGNVTDFGDSQITIFLINHDLGKLDEDIDRAYSALSDMGILVTRRDLRMEECFWAQLPGNFAFLSRRKATSSALVGGFASLYNFPAGKKSDNLWGPALTMFRTMVGTPYFFSFHVENNGHTAILGPHKSGKTVLLNFLVSESRKFNGRLFFFDQERASKVFIKSIGGYYTVIEPKKPSPEYAFNPLNIPDTPENREFLTDWLKLLSESTGTKASNEEAEYFKQLIDYVYQIPSDSRRLSSIAESFGPISEGSMGERMQIWHSDGEYAHLFDNQRKKIVPLDDMIYGFGMSHVVNDKTTLAPILSYLFHRIEISLDGVPTIVVLDEAWNLVNNSTFAPQLGEWLDRLREKNAIVIFATQTVPNDKKNEMTKIVTEKIATQIFMPNPDADESSHGYQDVWKLSEQEFSMLSHMRLDRRQFMLRQNGNAVVASVNLNGLKEVEILSGSDKTATIMEDTISQRGDNPEDWLSTFYDKIQQ